MSFANALGQVPPSKTHRFRRCPTASFFELPASPGIAAAVSDCMLASLRNSNVGSLRGPVLHTAIFSNRALRYHRKDGVRRIGGLKHFSSVTRACHPTDQSAAAAARLLDRFWQVRRSHALKTVTHDCCLHLSPPYLSGKRSG